MEMNNRGIVFTLMAIVISSVIVVSVQTIFSVTTAEPQPELLRVKIIDGITDSFISYAETALRISTQSALTNLSLILANQTDQNMNVYFTDKADFEINLRRCILNTSEPITSTSFKSSVPSPCINESYFPRLLDTYTDLVNSSFNIAIAYTYDQTSFSILQEIPFEVTVNLTVHINVTDVFVNWTIRDHVLSVRVPLTGVLDPLTAKFDASSTYTKSNFKAYTVKENREQIGNWSTFNTTNFLKIIINGEYRKALNRSPSFLQRYYGDFTTPSPCCGIESFIDGSLLNSAPWGTNRGSGYSLLKNYSFTDHELFGNSAGLFTPKTYTSCSGAVSGKVNALVIPSGGDTQSYFWLNFSTLDEYGLRLGNVTDC